MRPKKITNSDMLTCARRCIMQYGVGVSTQTIADQIGVSQATLFKRFGTKESLIHKALLQPIFEHSVFDFFASPPSDRDVVIQLKEFCISMLGFFEEVLPSIMMLRSTGCDLPEMMRGEFAPPMMLRHKLTQWFDTLHKQERIRIVSSEALALALIGAIQHRVFRLHILYDLNLEDSHESFVSSIVDIFWQGISPGDKS